MSICYCVIIYICRILEKVKQMVKSDDLVNESVDEDEDSIAVDGPPDSVDQAKKSVIPQDEGWQHAIDCYVIFIILITF